MDRALWHRIDSAEYILGECYREARGQRDWRAMSQIQVARGRLQYILAAHAAQMAAPDPMQLSLVPSDSADEATDKSA